jgi:hypothetical protein
MATFGIGYGSECHLLRYMGRHRHRLDREVLQAVGDGTAINWIDFPFASKPRKGTLQDAEWKGLDFLMPNPALQAAWGAFWPQGRGRGIMNWDAVGRLQGGTGEEWLLVEAKAQKGELQKPCAAVGKGRLQIETSLGQVKASLGVVSPADWLGDHYQHANRIGVLWFLMQHCISARLLCVYFTGDRNGKMNCPANVAAWKPILDAQDAALGLPQSHPLASRIHKVFLPVAG